MYNMELSGYHIDLIYSGKNVLPNENDFLL